MAADFCAKCAWRFQANEQHSKDGLCVACIKAQAKTLAPTE